MIKVKVYPDGFTTLINDNDFGTRGYISLGRGDVAMTTAREAALVLDAFVRPWTTDRPPIYDYSDVEILILPSQVVRGYFSDRSGWQAYTSQDRVCKLKTAQVAGWREIAYYKEPE